MSEAKMKLKRGTPEHKEFMRTIGKDGGENNKRNRMAEDPDYFNKLGAKGARARIANVGGMSKFRKIASEMGKKSGRRWAEAEEA